MWTFIHYELYDVPRAQNDTFLILSWCVWKFCVQPIQTYGACLFKGLKNEAETKEENETLHRYSHHAENKVSQCVWLSCSCQEMCVSARGEKKIKNTSGKSFWYYNIRESMKKIGRQVLVHNAVYVCEYTLVVSERAFIYEYF